MQVHRVGILLALAASAGVRAAEPLPRAPAQALPGEVRAPVLVEFSAAEYPPQALHFGGEGDVDCELSVSSEGAVTAASCDDRGDALFARGARDALRAARYRPASVNGQPAEGRVRLVYRFVVNREHAGDPPPFEPSAAVRGEVLAGGTRVSLAGVDVIAQGLGVVATTDARGRYSMSLPRGSHVLVFVSPEFGREQQRVEVGPGAAAPDTVYLRRSGVSDFVATVEGEKVRLAPTRETLVHEELRNVPGTQSDPIRVIENLPGIARAPFTGGQLIVRGAPAVDTGAYIDGQRIPVLYHLLNGPSVLGEDMVERIDFYPGGAGVYFGRNLAGVVAVTSRKGSEDRWHGSLASDLQKSSVFLQGPLGAGTQLAVGARISYVNPAVKLFADSKKELTLPVYWDYQSRADHKLDSSNRLSLLLYGSNDSFEQIGGGLGSVPLALGRRIGFHRLRLAWDHRFSDQLSLTVAPMVGLDLSDSTSSGAGPGVFARPQSQRERTFSSGLRAEASWKPEGDAIAVRAGTDILFDRVSYDLDQLYDQQLRGVGAPNAEEKKLSGVKVFGAFGEYIEAELRFGKLRVTPGLRVEVLHYGGHTFLMGDPRLWFRYALNDATGVYAYAGLYHQAPTAQQVDPLIGNPHLVPQASQQVGTGVERKLGELWSIKAEGYLSLRRSLVFAAFPRANGDGTYDNPLQANTGLGRSIGLEVLLRREFTERLYGWVAYTLSRSRERGHPGDAWIPTAFDQPHNLALLIGFRPSPYIEFAAKLRLATGNPLAEATGATFDADSANYVPQLKAFGATRLPTFVQLDFEVNNIWAGDVGRLQLYLDFQNLLDRENPEALLYDFRYQTSQFVHGLPFLASIGAKVTF